MFIEFTGSFQQNPFCLTSKERNDSDLWKQGKEIHQHDAKYSVGDFWMPFSLVLSEG